MVQVAFDTLKFVETLEGAGLPKNQAKAISLAVRESHETVDVATKRDLDDTRKELSTEIINVRKICLMKLKAFIKTYLLRLKVFAKKWMRALKKTKQRPKLRYHYFVKMLKP